MAQCPYCQTSLTDDFGLITCSGCGQSVFIDMDGEVQVAETSESSEVPNDHSSSALITAQELSAIYESELIEELEEQLEEPSLETPPSEIEGESIEQQEGVEDWAMPPEELSQPQQPSDENFSDEVLQHTQPGFVSKPDLSEISDFGNSEVSQALEGSLYFRLKIAGIDSQQIREELLLVLRDKKFMWNENELMSSIREGVLKIQDLSPAKAIALVNRLSTMPLSVEWEQYAIQDS